MPAETPRPQYTPAPGCSVPVAAFYIVGKMGIPMPSKFITEQDWGTIYANLATLRTHLHQPEGTDHWNVELFDYIACPDLTEDGKMIEPWASIIPEIPFEFLGVCLDKIFSKVNP